jgi:hypothetical protein
MKAPAIRPSPYQRDVVPQDPDIRRLAEDETTGSGRTGRIEAQSWQPRQGALEGNASLESGEMHAQAHMRAVGEANLEADVVTPNVEPVGLGEDGRVAIGTCERDGDEVAVTEWHARELGVARHVAIDHGCGGLEAERLLDGCCE